MRRDYLYMRVFNKSAIVVFVLGSRPSSYDGSGGSMRCVGAKAVLSTVALNNHVNWLAPCHGGGKGKKNTFIASLWKSNIK